LRPSRRLQEDLILPGVQAKTAVIVGGDRSALDVPDRGFSTAV
jgi:hypothetical protein